MSIKTDHVLFQHGSMARWESSGARSSVQSVRELFGATGVPRSAGGMRRCINMGRRTVLFFCVGLLKQDSHLDSWLVSRAERGSLQTCVVSIIFHIFREQETGGEKI